MAVVHGRCHKCGKGRGLTPKIVNGHVHLICAGCWREMVLPVKPREQVEK